MKRKAKAIKRKETYFLTNVNNKEGTLKNKSA